MTYKPPYVPKSNDVQYNMDTCLPMVTNITRSNNQQHNRLSLSTLQDGIWHIKQFPPPIDLSHYEVGADYTNTRLQWLARRNRFHVLWEDEVRMCTCHHCMYKLTVLIKSFLATQNLGKSFLFLLIMKFC